MDPKKNIFLKCLPCLGTANDDDNPEEYIKKNFGDQYSEYEYVIENLAITAVPTALLDAIPAEKPKKKTKNKFKIKSKVTKKNPIENDKESSPETTTRDEQNLTKEVKHKLPENSSLLQEDRVRKNKFFRASGCSQDVRYNPCYLHLCPEKNACMECKLGSENKKDLLRRMLVPPGSMNLYQNPLKSQV